MVIRWLTRVAGPVPPRGCPHPHVPPGLRLLLLLRQSRGPPVRAQGVSQHNDGAVRQPLRLVLLAKCYPACNRRFPHGQVGT